MRPRLKVEWIVNYAPPSSSCLYRVSMRVNGGEWKTLADGDSRAWLRGEAREEKARLKREWKERT